MNSARRFGRFIWDFVIGDDWRIALVVTIALLATLVLANNGIAVWWLLPAVTAAILGFSVWSVARKRS
jgi:hypothetical protein